MLGSTLSHYEILEEIGRGGMGIVYRARDTRLERIVALKVLPTAALASGDDRTRFFREAKAAAQLQHPHIAAVFDSDEAVPEGADSDGARPFIAMEYIDGESLADRIASGPLKISEAIRIAVEMAQALEAAHEKGIVHRDIKPQNVMLTSKGDVKVLDFGLAKTAATTMLTRQGSTLGTVAYMSPEQAAGEDVDRRTDLWSLGVTFYEMLTGRHPFARDYEQAVIYSILNEDPEPVTALRTGVSMELDRIVSKALEKDAELRYQTAAGCIADLKAAVAHGGSGVRRSIVSAGIGPRPAESRGRPGRMPAWGWAIALAAFLAGIAGAWVGLRDGIDDKRRVMRFGLQVLDQDSPPSELTVSPSTSYLAFSDGERVYVRDIETAETWEIPESDGVNRIVFTPDENWLILEKPGMILRSRIRDGRPFEVTSVAAAFTTANVTPDGALVYEGGGRIWRIGQAGSSPEPAIEMDTTIFYNEPRFAPDGRNLLVQLVKDEGPSTIGVFDYPSGQLRGELPLNTPYNRVLDTGHLVFVGSTDELQVVPVDLEEVRLLGPAVPLGLKTQRAAWSVSDAGHLFYAPVSAQGGGEGYATRYFRSVLWAGNEAELPPPRTFYEDVHLDPSGRRAAVMITEGQRDVWIVDLYSGFRTRITTGSTGIDPSWHPSADSVLYVARGADATADLISAAVDGSGNRRLVFSMNARSLEKPHWSPDARFILFCAETGGSAGLDIWQFDVVTGQARPVVGGTGNQANASYSPDGRYVVYDAPGADRESAVWVLSTRFTGLPQKVSPSGSRDARWSPDGREVFFMADADLMRVAIDTRTDPVSVGEPELVHSFPYPVRMWDPLPDGSGLVYVTDVQTAARRVSWADSSRTQVHVILNWVEELKELVPVPR